MLMLANALNIINEPRVKGGRYCVRVCTGDEKEYVMFEWHPDANYACDEIGFVVYKGDAKAAEKIYEVMSELARVLNELHEIWKNDR